MLTICACFSNKVLRLYKKAGLWAVSMTGPFSSIRFLLPLGYCAVTGDGLYGDEDIASILEEQSVFPLPLAIFLTICAYSSDTVIERACPVGH